MKEINDKFDMAETYVERLSKLILKIVTTLVALIVGIVFAWNQLKTTINQHVHQEDEKFQQYLKQIETNKVYEEGDVDTAFEDSLYRVFYHIEEVADTIVPISESNTDTVIPAPISIVRRPIVRQPIVIVPEVIDTIVDTTTIHTPTIIPVIPDTILVDTLIIDTIRVDTIN